MGLTQARFARLFAEAMDTIGVQGVDLARALDTHPTTISRYRSEAYKSGPPDLAIRRMLEDEMGLPDGYLDGKRPADLAAIRRAQQQAMNPEGVVHDGATLRAALQTIRGQLQAALRQLELAELLAGGSTVVSRAEDPAAEAELVEPREKKRPQTHRRTG